MKFLKQIKDDIQELKEEVGLKQRETRYSGGILNLWAGFCSGASLIDRVIRTEKQVSALSDKFNTLLKYFNIEYVEITEKNGGTKTMKKYRTIKKGKKVKGSRKDDDDDNDDD